ncbi:MAG: phosphomannomutase/phosphoglucomutase [Pseudomonadota bacterium]|nr:phosphomannomutase/phosphoglucomutase [Pseudomonadota bacterium]
MTHVLDPTILREYDIRGIVGKTLTEADATAVGRGFGTMIRRDGGTSVCIAYDGRDSSPKLTDAMVNGLKSTGLKVVRLGLGPTPMQYFAIKHMNLDAGVMITGSHNPPEYNGIKMTTSKGPVYGKDILKIGDIAAAGDFNNGQGSEETVDIRGDYLKRLLADFAGARRLTIAWDAGNGATGEILEALVAELPEQHHLLFTEIDGTFPNHHPDPTVPDNLVTLQKTIADKNCDLGIAFDGDGDRIGVVDETGRIICGDQLLAIYAAEVLEDVPGATIIADVKTSKALFDEITRLGGHPLMWKTGHSLIKAKMAETGAPLAGEVSGHIFFGHKYYGYDDALYCAVRLINIVSKSDVPLSVMIDRLPKMENTPEIRFQVDEARKFAVIDEVKARLAADPDTQVIDIDGVRVTTKDGWWLLRASNTQDVLVVRAEGTDSAALSRLKAHLTRELSLSGLTIPTGMM